MKRPDSLLGKLYAAPNGSYREGGREGSSAEGKWRILESLGGHQFPPGSSGRALFCSRTISE